MTTTTATKHLQRWVVNLFPSLAIIALLFVASIALVAPSSAADNTDLDCDSWNKFDSSFKLGWVSGYARAMDLAGTIHMATCASNMPLYVKEFPNTDPKAILQKMCLSDTQFVRNFPSEAK